MMKVINLKFYEMKKKYYSLFEMKTETCKTVSSEEEEKSEYNRNNVIMAKISKMKMK